MTDILAYDRMGSVRTFDQDGRLRVERTPISKANICPYRGNEIPEWSRLGLDPERIYRLLRDPAELERAAPSFNGLPVLEEHHHVTAQNPRRDLVVGTTGNDASFETPFLYNSLVIWDGAAIDRIKSGEQRELSSAYRYTADMAPGHYDGEPYDGVMRNISGSHVAVVPTGRAGPDVLVADAKPESMNMPKKSPTRREKLLASIRPFLANDADMEACNKALDDDLDDDDIASDDADFEAMAQKMRDAGMPEDDIEACRAMCKPIAADDDEAERRAKMREAGLTDDEIDRCIEALAGAARDEQDEADREREPEGAALSDEERARKEREDREREAAGARRADEERQTAMDAALAKVARETEARTIKRMNDLHAAREAVKPFVGSVAMDSAEGVYGFALKQEGYDLSGIPGSAYRAMFGQHAKNKAATASAPKMAADSAASLSFLDKFPGLKAVNVKA